MAISLEELKRQRAQIQKHLDWLDAKIRELGAQDEAPKAEEADAATVSAEPEGDVEEGNEPEEVIVPEVEIEGQVYQSKTQDELLRAKVGCFLFFMLGIVLFLFLLFGLPYYL